MEKPVLARNTLKPAAFQTRLIAFCIDMVIQGFLALILQFTIPYLMPLAVWVFYKTLFECSAIQATPGKRAMEIQVVSESGGRITLGRSFFRTLIAFLSVFTCFLIYLLALVTPKKQTFHDIACETLVVEGKPDGSPIQAWIDELIAVAERIRALFNR